MCKCPSCGAKLNISAGARHANPGNWTANSSARKFERVNDGPLTQTWPAPQQARKKGATRTRAEQSLALGGACTVCAFSVVSPLPFLLDMAMFVSASTFVMSVALGKDNLKAIFKFLDRNNDGQVDLDDLHTTIDELRDKLDDALARPGVPVHEPGPEIKVTSGDDTRQIPGPEPYIIRSLIIRAEDTDQPALVVELDVLCAFIRAAVGLGEWTRKFWTSKARGDYKLSSDTWQAYQNFFNRSDVALWKIDPPTPELPGIIVQFRQWATDQPETDRPTEEKNGN